MCQHSVAVVIGASSGIGAETAVTLADAGLNVTFVARREQKLQAVADRITDCAGEALVLPSDIRDREAVESTVKETNNTFGSIDVLMNAASVLFKNPVTAASPGEWQ